MQVTDKSSPDVKHDNLNKSEHTEYNDSPIKLQQCSNDKSVSKDESSSYISSPSNSNYAKQLEKQSTMYFETSKMIKNISFMDQYKNDN